MGKYLLQPSNSLGYTRASHAHAPQSGEPDACAQKHASDFPEKSKTMYRVNKSAEATIGRK